MIKLTSKFEAIYNFGERLIPGESHDKDEVIRHKSSYEFFYRIIESDIINNPSLLAREITILDVGSGTGHGTFMLSKLPGVKVTGLEPGIETVEYSKNNYSSKNIEYINTDLHSFIRLGLIFDYIVSRHALEHIVDGLDMILAVPFHMRLLVNVPFFENDKNPFHLVHWIDENSFLNYKNREFFYESITGETSIYRQVDNPPNSIVCVDSMTELGKVSDMISFPFPAWQPEFLQELGLSVLADQLPDREMQLQEQLVKLHEREKKCDARELGIQALETHMLDLENQLERQTSELAVREKWAECREEQLKVQANQVRDRYAEYDSLLLVKMVRKIKSIFK